MSAKTEAGIYEFLVGAGAGPPYKGLALVLVGNEMLITIQYNTIPSNLGQVGNYIILLRTTFYDIV